MKSHSRRPPAAHDAAPFDAPPAFTPVPVRYRTDGWTPERQRLYVAALARSGHAGKAARAVGMTEQSAAKLRRRPDAASFDAACTAAFLGARRRWTLARHASRGGRGAGRFEFISLGAEPYEPSEPSAPI
jgi:hypothetical protein